MRLLVTGGAGFIGSNTVDALIAGGHGEVAVLDDLSAGKRHRLTRRRVFMRPICATRKRFGKLSRRNGRK